MMAGRVSTMKHDMEAGKFLPTWLEKQPKRTLFDITLGSRWQLHGALESVFGLPPAPRASCEGAFRVAQH